MRYHQIRCSSRTCKGGPPAVRACASPIRAFAIIALRPDEAVDHQTSSVRVDFELCSSVSAAATESPGIDE